MIPNGNYAAAGIKKIVYVKIYSYTWQHEENKSLDDSQIMDVFHLQATFQPTIRKKLRENESLTRTNSTIGDFR